MSGLPVQPATSSRGRRRLFFSIAAAAVAAVAVAACAPTPSSQATVRAPSAYRVTTSQAAVGRPNIVFVLTDDLSQNLVAQMPAVLSLEQAGATLSHYYVVDSLCCPSRSAIFTGEYPHDDGVFSNSGRDGGYNAFQSHDDGSKTFARSLRQAGYSTAFMGKYLNNYTSTNAVPHGWDVWDGYDNGGYNEYNYKVNTNGVPVAFGSAPSDYLTDVLSQKAVSFISSAAQQARPFFLEVATFAPHYPSTPAPQYANSAQGALYPQTPAYNAQVTNPPPWLHQRAPLNIAQQQSLLAQYRLRVEDGYSVDDLITNIETTLTNAGVAGNTYIVFSSDNGYHMGEYRLLAGKQTAFDTDINVPLVVSGPGIPAGSTVSALGSSVDLAQTFDAIAGAKVNAKTDGRSLLPVLRGQVPTNWQRAVLIEHHGPANGPGDPDAQNAAQASPPSYEAVRTLGGLYVRYVGGATEYYDTSADPYELDNLGGGAAPAAMQQSLKELEHCHQRVACKNAAYQPFVSSTASKRAAKKHAMHNKRHPKSSAKR